MKSRFWLDNVETPNRQYTKIDTSPNIPHARYTHSEVELRKCCLGQSEKSEVPYYLKAKTVIFFIPKIIVVFRTDLHKMKINTELCCKRYDFFDKKDPKLSLSELLSRITRIQIYSYDLLCEPVLSMCTV